MKYTFEIMKEYEDAFKGISVYSVSDDKKLMVDFVALEELDDAQKQVEEAYQRGLDDAWEAAKKISLMPPDEIEKVFPGAAKYNRYNLGYSGVEAIAKLKAYEEQKAVGEIKVGDEVKPLYTDITGMVTLIDGDTIYVLWRDGSSTSTLKLKEVTKTGRHFGIESILEDMRE